MAEESLQLGHVNHVAHFDIADMDYVSWRDTLQRDADTLELLLTMISDITAEHDSKLQKLLQLIDQKIEDPINAGNKKIIVFSAFSDTADYLYGNIS